MFTMPPRSKNDICHLVVIGACLLAAPTFAFEEFAVQRGLAIIPEGDNSLTLIAGFDYAAPNGPAFVRISGTRLSGMGRTIGGGTQAANQWMAWVSDAMNLGSSFTFSRYDDQDETRIAWELVEYTGDADGPNEIIVRDVGNVLLPTGFFEEVGTTVAGVENDSDIMVLITGQAADDFSETGVHQGMNTADWLSNSNQPSFTRGGSGVEGVVSYAVIEFTGDNWSVQRTEHIYSLPGVVENETITMVSHVNQAFFHVQHRSEGSQVDQQGAEVWLSDTDELSFMLQSSAPDASSIASVVWTLANDQVFAQHVDGDRQLDEGSEEDVWFEVISQVSASGASILGENGRSEGISRFPHGSIALRLLDGTTVELRQCDRGAVQTYRYSVVEWPMSRTTSVFDSIKPKSKGLVLYQNVPNPFRSDTGIAFEVLREAPVRLAVYDLGGRIIKILVDEQNVEPGHHRVVWNGQDSHDRFVSTGIYFYRLDAGTESQTKKLLLVE